MSGSRQEYLNAVDSYVIGRTVLKSSSFLSFGQRRLEHISSHVMHWAFVTSVNHVTNKNLSKRMVDAR